LSFSDGSVDRITKQFETEKELDGFAENNLTESQRSTMAKSKQPLTVK